MRVSASSGGHGASGVWAPLRTELGARVESSTDVGRRGEPGAPHGGDSAQSGCAVARGILKVGPLWRRICCPKAPQKPRGPLTAAAAPSSEPPRSDSSAEPSTPSAATPCQDSVPLLWENKATPLSRLVGGACHPFAETCPFLWADFCREARAPGPVLAVGPGGPCRLGPDSSLRTVTRPRGVAGHSAGS